MFDFLFMRSRGKTYAMWLTFMQDMEAQIKTGPLAGLGPSTDDEEETEVKKKMEAIHDRSQTKNIYA